MRPVVFAEALASPVALDERATMRLATAADVDAVVAIEHAASMTRFIATWNREKHAARIAGPDFGYLAILEDGEIVGYAILSGHATGHRSICVNRIALARHGTGLGTRAMRGILALAFERLGAHRVFLDVMIDNERARRTYRRAGFREEGVMRDAMLRPDGFVDLVLLSILEDEWRALQPTRAWAG